MSEESEVHIKKQIHHDKLPLCVSRAAYRQGRKLTAVKAYSINDESMYLIISRVPDLKLDQELRSLCLKFGAFTHFSKPQDYPSEQFETAYIVKYQVLRDARKAKKFIDNKNFYGGILHVFYAPELESVSETKDKLNDRLRSVRHLQNKYKSISVSSINENCDKTDAVSRVYKRMAYSNEQHENYSEEPTCSLSEPSMYEPHSSKATINNPIESESFTVNEKFYEMEFCNEEVLQSSKKKMKIDVGNSLKKKKTRKASTKSVIQPTIDDLRNPIKKNIVG